MVLPILGWMFAFILTWSHNHIFAAAAQNCYYPNGDIATDDSPCSDSVGICCPLNWQCMDNGLCYLENAGYYERHTCTDRSWPLDSCPDICTQNMQAGGNEAILWCNHKDWCCDGNRSWNCCTTRDTDFFDLPDPHSVAFISVTPSVASTAAPNSHASSSPTTSDVTSSATPTPSSVNTLGSIGTSQFTYTSTTTGSDGAPSIIIKTMTGTSSFATGTQRNTEKARNNDDDPRFGRTIGLALGIPLFLGLCGVLIFYLFRRRRKSKQDNDLQRPESPPMEANYQNIAPGSHAPELQGFPVAAKRPKSGRYSELYGSDVNIHSPALSTGSTTTSLPQYSPGSPGNNGVMAQIPEEPQELWGGYVPYRPPREEKGGRE